MKIHASGEDYLEAILVLQKKVGMVRSVDLARHMGFSKPSISHVVGVLKGGGFLTVDGEGYLHLTEAGRETAEKIYERRVSMKQPQRRMPAGVNTLLVMRVSKSCKNIL